MVTLATDIHNFYMLRCLQLAGLGLGNVAPNPMVGSVVVYNQQIIGEGYHQQFGKPHAEVNAIASVSKQNLLEQATLYVNLEPCSHFGKTPPCADLIIEKKIPKVVIGSYDPNPLVSGKGIERLRRAGVEVITDIMKAESDFLNRRFMTFHIKHRPYIILKWAESTDGFMGLNEPTQFWFTGSESKKLTHKWRTEEPGILVGKNTVSIDDAELTARLWPGKNPIRIVIDRNLQLPQTKKIFNNQAATLVFNQIKSETNGKNQFIKIDFSANVLKQVLHYLFQNSIQSIIVEGGAETLTHFIAGNLWDEARVFTSTHQLGAGKKSPSFNGLKTEESKIETDFLKTYINPAA